MLECVTPKFLIAPLKLPAGSFPILEVLTIQLDGDDDAFDGLMTTTLENTPKLGTLNLGACGAGLAPDFLRFPFAQLTNLTLFNASTTPTDIYEVLERCTSLLWAEFSPDEEIASTYEEEKIIVPKPQVSIAYDMHSCRVGFVPHPPDPSVIGNSH